MSVEKLTKREFLQRALAFTGACALPGSAQMAHSIFGHDDLWKWSKEALYSEDTPRGPKCMVCPNECVIKPGELGDCRTRKNVGDKIYSIAYGNPCAMQVDPIEKKPLLHFLPTSTALSIATAGCNLACLNCQNWNISQKSPYETQNYDFMPDKLIEMCLEKQCKSIAYTYSEPIVFYEYVFDSAKLAREKGIKNVIVSAGYMNEKPLREWCKFIDAANIDLKGFDDKVYLKLNAGKLEPVLKVLKIYKEEGVWLEITNLIVPKWTDNLDTIKRMCDWLFENGFNNTPLHFSRFYPQHKLTNYPATPVVVLNRAHEIAKQAGLNYVYIGNVPGTKASNTFCPACKKLVIDRRGYTVLQNNIVDNKCKFCNAFIHGIWT